MAMTRFLRKLIGLVGELKHTLSQVRVAAARPRLLTHGSVIHGMYVAPVFVQPGLESALLDEAIHTTGLSSP